LRHAVRAPYRFATIINWLPSTSRERDLDPPLPVAKWHMGGKLDAQRARIDLDRGIKIGDGDHNHADTHELRHLTSSTRACGVDLGGTSTQLTRTTDFVRA
jgi:hypothetical protein